MVGWTARRSAYQMRTAEDSGGKVQVGVGVQKPGGCRRTLKVVAQELDLGS